MDDIFDLIIDLIDKIVNGFACYTGRKEKRKKQTQEERTEVIELTNRNNELKPIPKSIEYKKLEITWDE